MNQGTRWALLMQKNNHRKSHAWAPLSPIHSGLAQRKNICGAKTDARTAKKGLGIIVFPTWL
jgi:hypothetical protein